MGELSIDINCERCRSKFNHLHEIKVKKKSYFIKKKKLIGYNFLDTINHQQ